MSTTRQPATSIEISTGEAQAKVHGLTIPARPAILMELDKLMARDNADFRMVGDLVARDVTLAATMLKTVNSPAFGLKARCASVHTAVQMLGMRNAATLVTALSMRQFAQGGGASFERFWDSAAKMAGIAAFVSGVLPRVPRDDCYAFALFRDVGIPLLMMRWPEYRRTLKLAEADTRPMTEVEDAVHGTNHAVMGFLLARSWGLPEVICKAIQTHHDRRLFLEGAGGRDPVLTIIAVGRLAENLHDRVLTMRADPEWDAVGGPVLEHLGLSRDEYSDLGEEVASLKF